MALVDANHPDRTTALDDFAVAANFFDGRSHFHLKSPFIYKTSARNPA
jgi:hypothetical protein